MQVLYSFSYLLEHPSTSRLLDNSILAVLLDMLLQRYTLDIVHHEVDLLRHVDQFVEFDDIGMVQFAHDHDFSLHSFPFHRIIQSVFIVDLQSKLLHRFLVLADPDMRISTLSNDLAYVVVFDGWLPIRSSLRSLHAA